MSASVRDQFHAAAMSVDELGDIDQAITSAVQRRHRSLAVTAAAGVTCAAIVAAVFFGTGPGGSEPEPLRPPTPTPSLTSDVNGWPTTGRNPPGVYSLDGDRCGSNDGGSCNIGFMHNGYGSGDVDISINGLDHLSHYMPEWASSETGLEVGSSEAGTPVVVAGYDGIYRKVDDRRERWLVDIEGTPVAIQVEAKPGTSDADLAEAHAVIDSMRTGPALASINDLGFSLVFTVTTNDWDSG